MGRQRRLLRILLRAVTAASLVLCVATAVLWARSYRLPPVFHVTRGGYLVMADRGWVLARSGAFYDAAGRPYLTAPAATYR